MGNGFIVIDSDSWKKATVDQRSWMLFSTLRSLDDRIKSLEKKLFIDKIYSFFGGIVGGALAVYAYLGLKAIR